MVFPMKTIRKCSVIGYPRVGAQRELKFASEKYFKGDIDSGALEAAAKTLRASNWKTQQDAGIDFIASNDFSFYDGMLDTAFMLGVIPARYKNLCLSKLDTFFAMARGYQDGKDDVTALPMKKWFNTNYHYIVPEIEAGTEFRLDASKIKDEYNEARAAGVQTKINVIGPYTFLKLAHYTGGKAAADYAAAAAASYKQLLAECAGLGAEWVQIEEPCLVLDLSDADKELFRTLYGQILPDKQVKVLLQTYFGDVRDFYTELCTFAFDALGLDFVEGKETLRLIREHGFPKDKLLFAGVVNGKNIWRNNYEKTAALIAAIEEAAGGAEIVLSTSCSLLHVPYTTRNEAKLSAEVLAHFAFAEEKLCELKELASLDEKACAANKALFAAERTGKNQVLADKISSLSAKDFTRLPAFAEREAIQKKALNLPPFPTTTIGSFPQTKEVRANRAGFKKGLVTKEQYTDFNRQMIARCIKQQEEIGLDVLVHGEFERNDMVEYFGENLDGYLFTQNAWVQSYGTRCVKPPIIWGDITRKKPITVDWSVYAQSCTKHFVKGMLTGPVTILNWSFPREDISLKECAFQIALAIRDEVLDLEKNGIQIIQIDEAALKEKLPLRREDWHSEYLDWAIPAFNLVHSGCKAQTQIHTHMCYSEFIPIITDIDNMDADVITFEASRSNLEILQALKEKHFRTEVGPGVYDIHSPRVPGTEEILAAVRKMKQYVNPAKLWINPDCGLKTRGETETTASLKNMVAAAKQARSEG